MNAAATSQLSRAIVSGAEKEILILPKGASTSGAQNGDCMLTKIIVGPAGKVKLAPKVKAEAVKEHAKEVCG